MRAIERLAEAGLRVLDAGCGSGRFAQAAKARGAIVRAVDCDPNAVAHAWAAGVPVVATTLGAEGLEVQHGENILIGDSTEAMRDAIVSLALDSDRS